MGILVLWRMNLQAWVNGVKRIFFATLGIGLRTGRKDGTVAEDATLSYVLVCSTPAFRKLSFANTPQVFPHTGLTYIVFLSGIGSGTAPAIR